MMNCSVDPDEDVDSFMVQHDDSSIIVTELVSLQNIASLVTTTINA